MHHQNKLLYYYVEKYGALICYELVYISKLVLLNIKTCKAKGAIALKQEARTHRLTHDITVVISCLRRQLWSSFESFFRGEEIQSSKVVITTIHKLIKLSCGSSHLNERGSNTRTLKIMNDEFYMYFFAYQKKKGLLLWIEQAIILMTRLPLLWKTLRFTKMLYFLVKYFSLIISRKLANRLSHWITNGRTI